MQRFFNSSDDDYAALEEQARSAAYVQCRGVELPPFSVPIRSRIGFKVDAQSGQATLYIDKGCRYYGTNLSIRRWFEEGQIKFPSFVALRDWIESELRSDFLKAADLCPGREQAPTAAMPGNRLVAPETTVAAKPEASPVEIDPLITTLLVGQIKQIARKHGLEVQQIDPVLLSRLADKIRSKPSETASDALEQVLAEPFARAALLGQAGGFGAVVLHAGPPISCEPIKPSPGRRL